MVGSIAAWRMLRTRQPHVEIDRLAYPVAGVDLSAHNGIVDFDSLAAAGINFAYLKASEGISFRDPSFALNYAKGRRAGWPSAHTTSSASTATAAARPSTSCRP